LRSKRRRLPGPVTRIARGGSGTRFEAAAARCLEIARTVDGGLRFAFCGTHPAFATA